MERIMQIFYGNDFLPYKDKERTIHYPIVGNTFNGMNNVNELHFYVRDIGGVNNLSWVAIAKLPNGRILYELLTDVRIDHEIEENYVVFNVSQFYTQLKGEVYISLNGCRGEVEIETDQETGISTISGEIDDNTVVATGSIKLAINYAPQRPLGFNFELDQYQTIINALANKSNVINTIQVVVTLPSDLTDYNDGQLFYCNGTYYELVETSGVKSINIAEQNGLLGGEHALLRYNVSAITQINSMPEDSICLVNYGGKDYLYEDYEHTNVVVYDLVGETLYIYTGQGTDTFSDVISNTNAVKYLKQVGNNNVIYATNNSGEQTTLSYSNSVVANAIVRRNVAGQISVPLTPTDNSHATSKKYVDDKISEFAQNELQTVNTTTYPTLQDFLATTGVEGYIYLYPVDTTDLTKGYYRYIWENNSWLSLGTTEIDLSDYYTKTETYSKTESNNNFVSKSTKVAGLPLSGDISENNLFDKMNIKGRYATLTALQTASPSHDYCYLVEENNHWYYWNGSAWTDGGQYLSTSYSLEMKNFINQYYITPLSDLDNAPDNSLFVISDNNACNIANKPQYFRVNDHTSTCLFYSYLTSYSGGTKVKTQVYKSLEDNVTFYRNKIGANAWGTWTQDGLKYANYFVNYNNYSSILTDLNNALINSTYLISLDGTTISNVPSDVPSNDNVVLETITSYFNSTTQVLYQYLYSRTKDRKYARVKIGANAWGTWTKLEIEKTIDNYFLNSYNYSSLNNLNNAQKGSMYYFSGLQDFYSNISNMPSGVNTGNAILITYDTLYAGSTECLVQTFNAVSLGKSFTRVKIGTNAWGSWNEDGSAVATQITWLNVANYSSYVTDWNNVKTQKHYFISDSDSWNGISHSPTGVLSKGHFISYLDWYNTTIYSVTQIVISGSYVFSREYMSVTDTWSDWSPKQNTRTKIIIGSSADANYSSLVDGFNAARDIGNCDVYIEDGTYDVSSQIGNIGRGLYLGKNNRYFFSSNSKVVCNYTGNDETILTENSIFLSQTLYGDFEIYNLTAEASRIRYIVHDENGSEAAQHISRHVYHGCKFTFDNTNNPYKDTYFHCIGGGLGSATEIVIDSCIFNSVYVPNGKADAQYHGNWSNSEQAQAGKSNLIVKNSYFAHTFGISAPNPETQKKQLIFSGNSVAYDLVYNVTDNTYWEVYKWNNEIRGS